MSSDGPSPEWFSPRPASSQVRLRLFCLPHAGSGAAIFYRWKRLFPPSIDVVPVLLPGRETRHAEPPPDHAEAVANALTHAIQQHLDLPYAIFGHSMGALLAYVWARRIQSAGLPSPTLLVLSGKNAAHLPSRHHTLHSLPDEELVTQLERHFGPSRSSGAVLADPELRAIFLPTLRSDLKLVESYRHSPGPLLDCPLLILEGSEDPSVSPSGLAAWAELTRGPVTVVRLPGDHFYHVDPHLSPALIAKITSTLTADPPTSAP